MWGTCGLPRLQGSRVPPAIFPASRRGRKGKALTSLLLPNHKEGGRPHATGPRCKSLVRGETPFSDENMVHD